MNTNPGRYGTCQRYPGIWIISFSSWCWKWRNRV